MKEGWSGPGGFGGGYAPRPGPVAACQVQALVAKALVADEVQAELQDILHRD